MYSMNVTCNMLYGSFNIHALCVFINKKGLNENALWFTDSLLEIHFAQIESTKIRPEIESNISEG